MADAAYAILCQDSKALTGQFLMDDDVLRSQGIVDLDPVRFFVTSVTFNF
jgi:hypothetical protein